MKLNKIKENKGRVLRGEGVKFLLYTSPWIVGFLLLTIIPLLASFVISFCKWNIMDTPVFVGLENYRDVFSDPLFYQSLKVTFFYSLINVPVSIVITFLVALLLNGNFRYQALFRSIYYLPSLISASASAILMVWLFNKDFGLVNIILSKIGIVGPAWLSDEKWAIWPLIMMSIWGAGSTIMLYLSGFKLVPQKLHDIARLAGAGYWTRLKLITLPAMSPVLLFALITGIISSLQVFASAFISTRGGPNNATLFYALYLYNNAFKYNKMGKACALAWILIVIIALLSGLVYLVSKRLVYYGNTGDDSE